MVAARATPAGRGSEPNSAIPRKRRSARTAPCIVARLPRVVPAARLAAFRTARAGRAGGGARPARQAREHIPAAQSRTGKTIAAAVSAEAAAATGRPAAAVAAITTAAASQPAAVHAATASSSGDAAGLASQDASRPGGFAGTSGGGGHGVGTARPCPSHRGRAPDPAGSGYRPAAGRYPPGGTHPGDGPLPLMASDANTSN